ncbi:MAG: ribonuclease P protein component 4 [Promethearchaeota archaeon]
MSRRGRSNRRIRKIAEERMKILLRKAERAVENRKRVQRYVEIARRIGRKCKVRMPSEWRRRICRGCNSFLQPGVSCRVRLRQRREAHVVVTCLICGRRTRFLTKRE